MRPFKMPLGSVGTSYNESEEGERPYETPAIFYKVVRVKGRRGERFFSVSGICPVEYKVGEWVEAPVGGLLVFNYFPSADRFAELNTLCDLLYVFECEVQGQCCLPHKCLKSWSPCDPKDLEVLWNKNWDGKEFVPHEFIRWPLDTLAFRKVKLLKPIKGYVRC